MHSLTKCAQLQYCILNFGLEWSTGCAMMQLMWSLAGCFTRTRSRPRKTPKAVRFALALLFMAPGAAFGSDPIEDDASRWVPSIAFAGGFANLEADATVNSPQRANTAQDDSGIVVAQVGFDAELMSPQLLSGPWGPRLFVHGRFGLIFDRQAWFPLTGRWLYGDGRHRTGRRHISRSPGMLYELARESQRSL